MSAHRLLEGGDITAAEFRSLLDYIPSGEFLPRGTKKKAKDNKANVSADELQYHWGLNTLIYQIKNHGACSVMMKGIKAIQREYLQDLIDIGHDLIKLQKRPPVRITTVHGSKGREANLVVIVPDMAKASHQDWLNNEEGENRVAYVAVTRTKWALFLVQPERRLFYPYMDYLRPGRGYGRERGSLWDA